MGQPNHTLQSGIYGQRTCKVKSFSNLPCGRRWLCPRSGHREPGGCENELPRSPTAGRWAERRPGCRLPAPTTHPRALAEGAAPASASPLRPEL